MKGSILRSLLIVAFVLSVSASQALGGVKCTFQIGGDRCIWLNSEEPKPELATPKALTLPQSRGMFPGMSGYITWDFSDMIIIVSSNGPRQISNVYGLTDIVPITDCKYEIRYYTARNVAAVKSEEGLYTNTAPWFAKHIIENPDGTPTNLTRLRVSRCVSNETKVVDYTEYKWVEKDCVEMFTKSTGETDRNKLTKDGTGLTRTRTRLDRNGKLISENIEKYKTLPGGANVCLEERTFDSDRKENGWKREYYEDPAATGKFSRIRLEIRADGTCKRYDYNSVGLTIVEEELASVPDAAGKARIVHGKYYDFGRLLGESGNFYPFDPRIVIEKADDKIVSKRFLFATTNSAGEKVKIEEETDDANANFGNPGNRRTTWVYYGKHSGAANAGGPKSRISSDGSQELHACEFGVFVMADDPSKSHFVAGTGNFVRVETIYTPSKDAQKAGEKGRKEVRIIDKRKSQDDLMVETYIQTETGGFARTDWTAFLYDDTGRLTNTVTSGGRSRRPRF